MPSPFSRTLRFLDSDRRTNRLGVLLVLALLAGWIAWLMLARVTVYEVSSSARLEVKASAHTVSSVVAGRIDRTQFQIGSEVAAGDVLAVMDSETEQRMLDETQRTLESLRSSRKALDQQTQAEKEGLAAKVEAHAVGVQEVRSQITAAEARAIAAEQALARENVLVAKHAASTQEVEQAIAEDKISHAHVAELKHSVSRLEQDRTVDESTSRTHLAVLGREAADLDGKAQVAQATILRLQHEIELRIIRAPVAGRIEEVVEYHRGAVVRAGDKLGTIVPNGEPRAVALFPAAAVGRIRPGQDARLRLDGFPWTQYGLLRATVSAVGSEADGGLVRVELAIDADPDSPIPVQHGLPGSVEVATEMLSPAVLVLRAAGHFLAAKNRDTPSTNSASPGERSQTVQQP